MPLSDREIDRHTLTGPWDDLFVAMIRERCKRDGFSEAQVADQFRAHIDRGVLLLFKRVRSLNDLAQLMPREIYREAQNGGGSIRQSAIAKE